MNALEKCLDMLLAVGIMFLLPLLFYSGGNRSLRTVFAGQACETFLRRVSTAGEITFPVWKELESALDRYGCDDFELCREYTLWEPGEVKGTVTEQYYIEGKEQLSELICTEGSAGLHKGDKLSLFFYINGFTMMCTDVVRSEGKVQ